MLTVKMSCVATDFRAPVCNVPRVVLVPTSSPVLDLILPNIFNLAALLLQCDF